MPEIWEINPTLSSVVASEGVADSAGTLQYQPGVVSEAAGDVAFAGPLADFILRGVVNGTFAQGPPDSTQNIDPIDNPLPYWTGPTQVSGGAITATWIADSASPSGHNLRFTMNAGVASDEAFFEQIIPISGNRRNYPSDYVECNILGVTTLTSAAATVKLQYLAGDGSAVGSEVSSGATTLPDAGVVSVTYTSAGALVHNARFLRIRINFYRNTASTSGTGVWDITDVTRYSGHALVIGDSVDPTTYPIAIVGQGSGNLAFIPNNTGNSEIDFLSTGGVSFPGQFIGRGFINPTISADQNDWAPTGLATCFVIHVNCGGASRTITGLSATGWTEGQIIWITCYNTAGGTLTLANNSASSALGNRFQCPGSVNYVINGGGGVAVQYAPTIASGVPFRVLGKS